MTDVVMPQLGESVTEGTIVAWNKAVGDNVHADEFLCDVSTDKVTFEIPAPAGGVLTEILAAEDQVVAVGAVIARIAGGEAAGETPAEAPRPSVSEIRSEPTGRPDGKPRPSPLARRLACENGIDLTQLTGSGAYGRVRGEDVRKAIAGKATAEDMLVDTGSEESAHRPGSSRPVRDGDTVIPFSPARRSIAEHMVRSVRVSPHGYIAFEVDYGAIERVRAAKKETFRATEGFGLTYLPFVLHAVARALRDYPLVNSEVDGDNLIVRRAINIGVAVDLEHKGLVVPVIRDADSFNVTGLARAIAERANKARSNRLGPDDLADGTFTVTNPGPSGTRISVPIINQPQTAILVMDGVARRPAVVTQPDGSEALAIRPMGMIGLSMDHRAFDGAYAAGFLTAVKRHLETTDWNTGLTA